jgi:Acetyl-CoA carboxylase, carboxyltransferase component (subunits alpha and beta)
VLVGYGSDYMIGGGMVVGIGVIVGAECVIMGNDPSVFGGVLIFYAGKKWSRVIEIVRDNCMLYISFVELVGVDFCMGGVGSDGLKI